MAESAEKPGGIFRTGGGTFLPLKEVAVKATLKGCVLGLVARMLYKNEAPDPAEVAFRMPVEQSQAVVAMSAVIDGRKIEASIREKKRAEEMYDDAIASGFTAALGKQQTGDIFSISLGNLRGGGEAQVELHFVDELPIDAEGNVRFSLPTTLKPRYTPAGSKDDLAPIVGEPDQVTHVRFSGVQQFELKILDAESISAVTSPTHRISVSCNSVLIVTIADGESLEKDLVILINPKEPHQPKALVEAGIPIGDDQELGFMAYPTVMVSFFPKIPKASVSCEFIFLVDRSGSMAGSFIRSAAETLVLFLKSLPEGSYFNIIGFGSGHESLFPSSLPYNQKNLDKATAHAQSLAADLGGTEVLQPLRYIFDKCPPVKGLSRQIFLLTDGSVSNPHECIKVVKKNAHKARCFTFGIGSGASSLLVNGIAKAGLGTAEFVKENERLQPKVVRSLKHAMQPGVLNVSVSFNVPQDLSVIQVPKALPPVYDGNKLLVYGLLRPKSDNFTLREISGHAILSGTLLGDNIEHQIAFSVSLEPLLQEGVFPAHRLAAKAMIKEMEEGDMPTQSIVDLSMKASVLSHETAFIAIEEGSDQVVGAMMAFDVVMEPRSLLKTVYFGREGKSKGAAKSRSAAVVQPKTAMFYSAPKFAMLGKKKKGGHKRAAHSQVVSDSFGEKEESMFDMQDDACALPHTPSAQSTSPSAVVALQQANGSWLLSDSLLLLLRLDRNAVEAACPPKCGVVVWATVLALTLLKARYGKDQEELELVISKAQSWLQSQPLHSELTLEDLYAGAENLLT